MMEPRKSFKECALRLTKIEFTARSPFKRNIASCWKSMGLNMTSGISGASISAASSNVATRRRRRSRGERRFFGVSVSQRLTALLYMKGRPFWW